MRKALILSVSLLFAIGATSNLIYSLLPLDDIDVQPPDCGCTFHVVPPGEPCVYDSPDVIFLDPHAKVPTAQVNIGAGNILLRHSETQPFITYQCVEKKRWKSAWKAPAIAMQLDLTVLTPDGKQCWFEGTLRTSRDGQAETRPVKGHCGCWPDVA